MATAPTTIYPHLERLRIVMTDPPFAGRGLHGACHSQTGGNGPVPNARPRYVCSGRSGGEGVRDVTRFRRRDTRLARPFAGCMSPRSRSIGAGAGAGPGGGATALRASLLCRSHSLEPFWAVWLLGMHRRRGTPTPAPEPAMDARISSLPPRRRTARLVGAAVT